MKTTIFHQWWRSRWLQFLIVASVVIVGRFYPLLFQSKTLLFGDNYSLMVPGKLFLAEWLRQGIMPWWNPLIFGGLSLVGDVNQSLFYPTTWAFLWFSPAVALNLTILVHLFIAGLGAYGLTYRLTKHQMWSSLAGVMWLLSTQVSGSINNLSTIQTLVWLPWLVWAGMNVPRSGLAKLQFGLLVLVQFLAGYPQHVLYSILMAVGLSAYLEFGLTKADGLAIQPVPARSVKKWQQVRDWLVAWAVAGGLAVALSAMVWWPFLETLQHSTRTIQTQSQSEAGSLHPTDLIKLITPYFFDNPAAGVKWGPQWNGMSNLSVYMTWLGLLVPLGWFLAGKARRWDWVAAMAIFGTILFALGGNLPGFTQLQALLPIFRISRGPSTMLMLTTLVWIVWLATILSRPWAKSANWQKLERWVFGVSLVIMAGTGVAWWLGQTQFQAIWQAATQLLGAKLTQSPFHTAARDQLIWSQIFGSLAMNAAAFSLAWYAWRRQWRWLVVAVMVVDLTMNTQGLFFYAPSQVYKTAEQLHNSELVSNVLPKDMQSRVLIRNYNVPYTDFSAYWEALALRAPFSDSFVDDKELTDFAVLQRLANGLTPDWNMVAGVRAINGYTTLLPQAVNQTWVKDPALVSINNLPEIKLTQPELKTWSVKYYLVDQAFEIKEDLSGLKKVGEKDSWVVYELPETLARFRWADTNQPADICEKCDSVGPVETPNRIDFWVGNVTAQPRPLLMADRFDPNWRAIVDGQSVAIQNVADQRQIMIPPGGNQVRFEFIPMRLYQGVWVSGLSLILAISVLVCLTKRR